MFLGHRISRFGIKPLDEKVEALVQAKPPENVQQLKAYLGLLNYYGRFLRDLSEELHPLHKLLQKRIKWIWGPEQECCFEKTEKMILSAKVLVHYDPNKPLILHTDASQYGLGAVMSRNPERWLRTPSWICFQNYECGREELLSAGQRRYCSDFLPEEVPELEVSVLHAIHHCDRSQTPSDLVW